MDLHHHWPQIRAAFEAGIRSSLHCAIASLRPDGFPHVTPIGHIFLREEPSAFYFEEHTRQLPLNLAHDPRVCLSVVDSRRWLWASALLRGHFSSAPGLRLFGVAGEKRRATSAEIAAYQARVGRFRYTKGYASIWKDLAYVRDVRLERCEPVAYPVMTDGLWRA